MIGNVFDNVADLLVKLLSLRDVAAPGFWTPPLVGGMTDSLEVTLVPINTLVLRAPGTSSDSENVSTPKEGRITFLRSESMAREDENPVLKDTLPCPVEGQDLVCRVPSGILDLRIDVAGYAPKLFWNLRTTPRRRQEIVGEPFFSEPVS